MTTATNPVAGPRQLQFGPLQIEYDERVLAPRPWTFAQSSWAAELAPTLPAGPILELCAGAGHIGLAAAVLADRDLIQVDANPAAVAYAIANAARSGWSERAEARAGQLQHALAAGESFPLIIADPPYLPSADVKQWPDDPVLAIDGGEDGLALVRDCLAVAAAHLAPGGELLLQVAGPQQDRQVAALLAASPAWGLRRIEVRVVDDARAITRIARNAC
ncbi:methyltransferase [uncultured Jatrophihabitans sp.]|uniref:methyltransferase n=1 Tax=uncultured Jatrophihabitans sp. TaxID=1610747 RepID=UPI0035C97934